MLSFSRNLCFRKASKVRQMLMKQFQQFQWFEEKQQQIDALDQQLRKLHSSIEALVQHRKGIKLLFEFWLVDLLFIGQSDHSFVRQLQDNVSLFLFAGQYSSGYCAGMSI